MGMRCDTGRPSTAYLQVEGIERFDLVDEAVNHGLISALGGEGTEQSVPHDEHARVILVDAVPSGSYPGVQKNVTITYYNRRNRP